MPSGGKSAHGVWSSEVPSKDPISPPTDTPPGSVFDSFTGSAAFHMNVAPFSKNPSSVDSMRPSVSAGCVPLRTLKMTPSVDGGTVRAEIGGATSDRFMNRSMPSPPVNGCAL